MAAAAWQEGLVNMSLNAHAACLLSIDSICNFFLLQTHFCRFGAVVEVMKSKSRQKQQLLCHQETHLMCNHVYLLFITTAAVLYGYPRNWLRRLRVEWWNRTVHFWFSGGQHLHLPWLIFWSWDVPQNNWSISCWGLTVETSSKTHHLCWGFIWDFS